MAVIEWTIHFRQVGYCRQFLILDGESIIVTDQRKIFKLVKKGADLAGHSVKQVEGALTVKKYIPPIHKD